MTSFFWPNKNSHHFRCSEISTWWGRIFGPWATARPWWALPGRPRKPPARRPPRPETNLPICDLKSTIFFKVWCSKAAYFILFWPILRCRFIPYHMQRVTWCNITTYYNPFYDLMFHFTAGQLSATSNWHLCGACTTPKSRKTQATATASSKQPPVTKRCFLRIGSEKVFVVTC